MNQIANKKWADYFCFVPQRALPQWADEWSHLVCDATVVYTEMTTSVDVSITESRTWYENIHAVLETLTNF